MAKLYNGNNFSFRIDKIVYISKENNDGKPVISYFLDGISIKFAISYENEEVRDSDYNIILDEMISI